MPSNLSKDIWHDLPVLRYLSTKCYGPHASESEKSRVRKRASRHVLHCGRLYRLASRGLREVPPVNDRLMLVAHMHHLCGHRGEKTVLKELRQRYFWEKMESDVKNTISQCSFCRRAKATITADTSLNRDMDDRPQDFWENTLPKHEVDFFEDERTTPDTVHPTGAWDWWLDGVETVLNS